MPISLEEWKREGFHYRSYRVTRVVEIPELQCPIIELAHEPSGATILHIPMDDPENFFCLSFQTLPSSSNGVAHILEHCVLCGSEKFPVKDPFFSMHRRSLNTFLNAFTGADFTCYPAATQVPQDFYNLFEVYLDAVFRPLLSKLSFRQEGHRLEFSVPDDPATPLERKGIVFNEMKGSLTSPSTRLHEAMSQALFPSSPYGYNSGGDPKEIPHLTYTELVEFHQKYYHPSRCLFFFYGDMPLEGHLDFLDRHAFEKASLAPPLAPSKPVTRYLKPIAEEGEYPFAEEESDQTYVSFGWLTCDIKNQEEILALNILEIVLMDNDASPLKRILQHSGLCKQANSYMEDEKEEVPWTITLKGCPPDAADELESLLFASLEKIIQDGISRQAIENAMHQLEFHRSEITGDHYPFGLTLFMRSSLLKQHGVPPENGCTVHTHFARLREKLERDPDYFNTLIRTYLIDNPHRVRIVLRPSPTLGKEEEELERQVLKKIREEMDEKEVQSIIDQSQRLKEYQEELEGADVDLLPKIHLKDVPKKSREFSLIKETRGAWEIFSHETFTNEIVYADIHLPLPATAPEDLAYLALFANLLTQLGSGERNYIETLEYMQAHTGGVGSCLSLFIHAQNHHAFLPHLIVRGKALERELPALFELLRDLFRRVDLLDINRLKELIEKHVTAMESHINQAALRYAKLLSTSGLNVVQWLQQQWAGLPYLHAMRHLMKNFDREIPRLVQKFSLFHQQIFGQKEPHLVLTCQRKPLQKLHEENFFGLLEHTYRASPPWATEDFAVQQIEAQGRIIASPVAFCAQAVETISYVHPHSPLLGLAASLFDHLVLHPRIREQGGAYGGGATCHPLAGIFSFFSYRDPHIASTLHSFQDAVQTIASGNFDDENLIEAKLEMIQALDSPISPGSRGALAYQWQLQGKGPAVRQLFRDRVLAASREGVQEAVREHLAAQSKAASSPVVFASQELLTQENQKLTAAGQKPLSIYPIVPKEEGHV